LEIIGQGQPLARGIDVKEPHIMKRIGFFIDDELDDALDLLFKRDGVRKAESIRRAIAAYVEAKQVAPTVRVVKVKRRGRK
jgi:predicted transcriptional regulator